MVEQTSHAQFIGATCGTYRLEQLINVHTWGPIFQVRNRAGTEYILRLIDVATNNHSDVQTASARMFSLGRFQQEASRVAALSHPHILPLLDYGYFHDLPYLVYPATRLVSLRTLLTQQGATDLPSVGHYLDQIAHALTYAHAQAVLHRNLSTQCIYVQPNRQLMVTEFGLLRMVELNRLELQEAAAHSADEPRPPRQQSFDGSSESSSPEQILGQPTDASTDIYALGAVLYRLLTGHAPFEGKTRNEVSRQHLYALVPPLSTWRDGLSVDLDHIIGKAMAKEPELRYNQPAALAQAYQQITAPGDSPHLFPVYNQPAPAQNHKRRSTEPLVRRTQPLQPLAKPVTVRQQLSTLSRRRFILAASTGGVVATAIAAFLGMEILGDHKTATANIHQNPTATTQIITPPRIQPTGTLPTQKTPAQIDNVIAQASSIPINSAITFPIANKLHPGLLIHLPNKNFVAFDSTCTHAGCAVGYNSQSSHLECPCHGAVFDPASNGSVLQGPAQTALAAISIIVNANGTIMTK